MTQELIQKHGGYRQLKSFQVSEIIYDLTVRFCDKYISRFSRTRDQMIQAARSGRQNIAEGSMASATSRKTELKLTGVAKASLEELRLDYEDYLRQNRLAMWERNDHRRCVLIESRPKSADEVAKWAISVESTPPDFSEIAANGALALIAVAVSLLDRQMKAQARAFEEEGGFTERLYRVRSQKRKKH